MKFTIVYGDITEQKVDAIVNSWNRNLFPWWLLLPQGVSGAIKKKAGLGPFNELSKMGILDLGEAVYTSAGRLAYKGIIHVAGINFLWTATPYSISTSVKNAVRLAEELNLSSIALPIIGAGSGRFKVNDAERLICDTLTGMESGVQVIVVKFRKNFES